MSDDEGGYPVPAELVPGLLEWFAACDRGEPGGWCARCGGTWGTVLSLLPCQCAEGPLLDPPPSTGRYAVREEGP